MAWDIKIPITIRDAEGVRDASPSECDVLLAAGGVEGINSLTARLCTPGDFHECEDGWLTFTMCPSTFGVVECGAGRWGVKVRHIPTGKTMCREVTIHDGTYSLSAPWVCAW